MASLQELQLAIDLQGIDALNDYWRSHSSVTIKEDLRQLANRPMDMDYQADLKAFTMAAMQGLLSNSRIEDTDVVIADLAVAFARATLTELSKQQ